MGSLSKLEIPLKFLKKCKSVILRLPPVRNNSWWSNVKKCPPDAILGVSNAFKRDTDPKKMDLSVGAYRDDDGNPFVLPCVREAEKRIFEKKMDNEYAFGGIAEFTKHAIAFALGDESEILKCKCNASLQSISGSGALLLGATFLNSSWSGNKVVYVPTPTWPNHRHIFSPAGLKCENFRYYDPKTCGLDFNGMMEDVCNIPEKSIILLHACAHNPTGVDPTKEQWCCLSEVIKKRNLLVFFDIAYQGFASGDPDRDAQAVRIFEKDGHKFILAQSFAKNMGLYGHRIGLLTISCFNSEEVEKIISQLENIVRSMYSSPPIHGGRIVAEILCDEQLKQMWMCDLKTMTGRIIGIRQRLKENLIQQGSQKSWDHITNQIGMFCYTGLTPENVERLISEFHIYLTKDGRISIAGVTTKNVEYLANAMHTVTK